MIMSCEIMAVTWTLDISLVSGPRNNPFLDITTLSLFDW